MTSLGEQYPIEQARLRELMVGYREIGPAGAFGLVMLEDLARRADQAAISGDIVAMMRCYQEMVDSK